MFVESFESGYRLGSPRPGRTIYARKLDDPMSTELWRTRPYARHLQHIIDGRYEQTFVPFTSSNPADGGSTGFQSLPVNV